MSILSMATTGRQIGAQIHTIAGDNGVGKTTFAASFPKAFILDLENGSRHIDTATRLSADKIPDLATFRATLAELIQKPHDYKTIVIDSVEALEGLICAGLCAEGGVASIEEYGGGYGKCYVRLREIMREIMGDLRLLQGKNITSILVAHTQTKSQTNPATNQTYDRVIMRANDKLAAVVRDLSDNVFYATYQVFTEEKKGKTKAFGDGGRVMYTQWRPGFDAKNRLELPLELPLSYDAFIEACETRPEADATTLIKEIEEMSAQADEQIKKQVQGYLDKYRNDAAKLQQIKTKLMSRVA